MLSNGTFVMCALFVILHVPTDEVTRHSVDWKLSINTTFNVRKGVYQFRRLQLIVPELRALIRVCVEP